MKQATAWIIGVLTLGYVAAQPGSSGSQSCPADRVVDGVQCGRPRQSCPASSTCTTSATGSGGVCCWEVQSAVEAPCMDPLMNSDNSNFVTCSSRDNPCPGSCYRCQDLSGVGLGLCCPNASMPGCADTAPNANLIASSEQSMASVRQGQWSSNTNRASSGVNAQSQSFPSQSRGSIGTQSGQTFQDQRNGHVTWGESGSFGNQQGRGTPPGASGRSFQNQPSGQSSGETGRERPSGFTRTSGGGASWSSQSQGSFANQCPGALRFVGRCQNSNCPRGSDCFGGVCCVLPGGSGVQRTRDPRRFMEQRFARGFGGATGRRTFQGRGK